MFGVKREWGGWASKGVHTSSGRDRLHSHSYATHVQSASQSVSQSCNASVLKATMLLMYSSVNVISIPPGR
jgi:hypothetical protein